MSEPTVGLDTEVSIEGATEEQAQMYVEMAAIFEEMYEQFVSKNLDYGSSFLTAGEVDMAYDQGAGPFATEQEANLYKTFTRIQDKDSRFYNQAFGGGQNRVDEDADETAGDAGVYWFMVVWMLRHAYGEETDSDGHGVGLAVDEDTGEIA